MVSANLVQALELVARGVSLGIIGRYVLYMLPLALQFTIPLAVLCSAVLVFSRLSADQEITAMRASGISLWQIVSPGLILAVALSAVCIYLQAGLSPECRYQAYLLRRVEGVRNPVAFLEPGRYVEFPGHIIYVGGREEESLSDIQIYILDENGQVSRDITAREGAIRFDEGAEMLELSLSDVVIGEITRGAPQGPTVRHSAAADMTYRLDYRTEFSRKGITRRPKHMTVRTVLGTIYIYERRGVPTGRLYLELHRRMSLALSPIGFLLLGIPFGIRTRRSETSVGLVVSLALAMCFYIFLAVAESLETQPQYHPEILVWLPNVFYQIGGLTALYRISRH